MAGRGRDGDVRPQRARVRRAEDPRRPQRALWRAASVRARTHERLDAYLGSPWGQYYFAAPAVAWSDAPSDLAARTWRVRLPFTLAGWLGVLLLGSVAARLWPGGAGERAWFWLGFGACLVVSVSLQLHLREVRYYPLVVFALGAPLRCAARCADLRAAPHALLAPALFGLFNLFYPAFTAVVATAAGALALRAWRARSLAASSARRRAYGFACAAALPVVVLFRVPEQSREFFEDFGADYEFLVAPHVGRSLPVRFELLVPALLGAIALAVARRQLGARASALRRALRACDSRSPSPRSGLLLIARTPLFFSRYSWRCRP